jgi:hypothetical protein
VHPKPTETGIGEVRSIGLAALPGAANHRPATIKARAGLSH